VDFDHATGNTVESTRFNVEKTPHALPVKECPSPGIPPITATSTTVSKSEQASASGAGLDPVPANKSWHQKADGTLCICDEESANKEGVFAKQ
jgi:hypothetical protein